MNQHDEVLTALPDPVVRNVLGRLHACADREKRTLLWRLASQLPRLLLRRKLRWDRLESRLDDAFIAVDRRQGVFLYLLARASGATRVVEFGTSFGVSTIYLACGVRDNGGGLVIGTERVPSKAEKAREHLQEANLAEFAEVREGDALATLREVEGPVDLLLIDGFPAYAVPVLELMRPKLRSGGIVVADIVGAYKADHAAYLSHVRDPNNGFASTRLGLSKDTEMSVLLSCDS